ncbi:hypothetical protein EV361DRAFT_1031148 [Lentinula raphanica]|nr:hypothetical protein EV361DRAFT_1031148 [Lentinula raphanica]
MDDMEVDPPFDLSSSSFLPPQHIEVDGHAMDIAYPTQPQPIDSVLLPGSYKNGIFYTVYQDINSFSRPALQELCKQYSLTPQGNKAAMKERLVGFSEHKIRWQCLLPAARRAHRGVRQGGIVKVKAKLSPTVQSKAKKPKASTQRRGELMGFGPDIPLSAQVFAAEHSKDTRTVEQRNNLVRWAKDFCASHPYVPREEIARRRKIREEEWEKQKVSDTALVSDSIRSMTKHIAVLTARIEALTVERSSPPPQLISLIPSGLPTVSSLPQTPVTNPSPVASIAVVSEHLEYLSSLRLLKILWVLSGAFSSESGAAAAATPAHATNPVVPSPSNRSQNERIDRLVIGHGQVIQYNYYRDVHEPRQISFALNIPRLSRVWDDEHPSWDPVDCSENLLEINGKAIALRYWPEIFRGRKGSSTWSWLKKLWTEWRYVAERYRQSSPESFWQEFSSSKGKRFHWKDITKQLCDLRNQHEQSLVDRARAEYGDQFGVVFVNNRGVQLTDPSTIARRYLEELSKRSQ